MNPTISIITPLFNTEKYVAETIESVLAQTYSHWELIIVDDGSTDKSCEIVANYISKDSRIKLFKRNRLPKGGTVCRNIGIQKSGGDYIMFLDSDDLLYPSCLENRINVIKANKDLDFAVFQMDAFAPYGKVEGRFATYKSDNYLYSFLSHNLAWAITCPLWKNKFIKEKLISFDERFPRLQDPEFHTRALLIEGARFEVYPDIEYLDCSYRVEYKQTNLTLFLQGTKLYLNTFIEKIRLRSDSQSCLNALSGFFDNIYSQYATSSVEDMKSNLNQIKSLNKFFKSNKLISLKTYRKANMFLFCVRNNLFRYKIFTFTLRKLGFKYFYGYKI